MLKLKYITENQWIMPLASQDIRIIHECDESWYAVFEDRSRVNGVSFEVVVSRVLTCLAQAQTEKKSECEMLKDELKELDFDCLILTEILLKLRGKK